MLGLDATQFDTDVIRKTNNTSACAFPVILDVDHPEFFKRLDHCAARNLKLNYSALKVQRFLGVKGLKVPLLQQKIIAVLIGRFSMML